MSPLRCVRSRLPHQAPCGFCCYIGLFFGNSHLLSNPGAPAALAAAARRQMGLLTSRAHKYETNLKERLVYFMVSPCWLALARGRTHNCARLERGHGARLLTLAASPCLVPHAQVRVLKRHLSKALWRWQAFAVETGKHQKKKKEQLKLHRWQRQALAHRRHIISHRAAFYGDEWSGTHGDQGPR